MLRALSLLKTMQKEYNIKPDAIVFNTLIQGAAARKNPEIAEQLLEMMQTANVAPSSYTLCQCVKLFGKPFYIFLYFLCSLTSASCLFI